MNWHEALKDEKEKPYFKELIGYVNSERKKGAVIYPATPDIFNAFQSAPLDNVRVVLLGQDPYHGRGQAHGLCFSVQKGTRIPPSLQNIFKELRDDIGITIPDHGGSPRACRGDLSSWAHAGVLLLNSVLTVEEGRAGSHAGKGWETFTDAVIKTVNDNCEHVVFLLWGNYAKEKGAVIDAHKHTILSAPHPSPFSARQGFFGCRHFSKTNEALEKHGQKPIDWQDL